MREVYCLDEPDKRNTKGVIKAVVKCIEETKIDRLIVASTSGKTALRFAEELKDKGIRIICL